jgi:hypothetical protein
VTAWRRVGLQPLARSARPKGHRWRAGLQREYTLKGLVEKIECPTLVCDNVADAIAGGQAKQLYPALRRPKDYVVFTAEEGADGHCEGGAQVLFNRVAYDWLDNTLAS